MGRTWTAFFLTLVFVLSLSSTRQAKAAGCDFNANGYAETGVGNFSCSWTLNLRADQTAIVGGLEVTDSDGRHYSNGFYAGYGGPGTVVVSVTNGFAKVVASNMGNDEWCFRLDQTHSVPASRGQPDWAHSTVKPLPGWVCNGAQAYVPALPPLEVYTPPPVIYVAPPELNRADCASIYRTRFEPGSGYQSDAERGWFRTYCSGYVASQEAQTRPPAPTVQPAQVSNRRPTGVGGIGRFNQGENVIGFKITLDSGTSYSECVLLNAPSGGSVTDGVVVPDNNEIAAARRCAAAPTQTSAPSGERKITGDGGTLSFAAGTPVIGVDIMLGNGQVFHSCYAIPNVAGSVKTGVLFPNQDEINKAPRC